MPSTFLHALHGAERRASEPHRCASSATQLPAAAVALSGAPDTSQHHRSYFAMKLAGCGNQSGARARPHYPRQRGSPSRLHALFSLLRQYPGRVPPCRSSCAAAIMFRSTSRDVSWARARSCRWCDGEATYCRSPDRGSPTLVKRRLALCFPPMPGRSAGAISPDADRVLKLLGKSP